MPLNIHEYFRSGFEDKSIIKMPDQEDEYLTPATRLLEKRREMADVEAALNAQKEEFRMKMEGIQQRKEDLDRKEVRLKEDVAKFDQYLKENDAKRTRALKKAEDERELQNQKTAEIDKLSETINQLLVKRDLIADKLEIGRSFNDFMERVLEESDEFQEVREIIARYETLKTNEAELRTHLQKHVQEALMEIDEKNEDTIKSMRNVYSTNIEKANNTLLSMNNKISKLQSKLDIARNKSHKWESAWNRIQATAAEKTLLLGQIKMATRSLYLLVLKHLATSSYTPEFSEDSFEQLDKIIDYIKTYSVVTKYAKESIRNSYEAAPLDKQHHQKILRRNLTSFVAFIIELLVTDLAQITNEMRRSDSISTEVLYFIFNWSGTI
ncbi:hypothetical protein SNEBB_003427 [Seison nebaliae]|nr:hypothetical protein SNEBB_003427 [Seison nebaliae]